jgi:hypothetical protein
MNRDSREIIPIFISMKVAKILLLIVCLFMVAFAFSQSQKSIEQNLSKSYKRIEYWGTHHEKKNSYDSLEKANNDLGNLIKTYAVKYPLTITAPFKVLARDLDIPTAADGHFRIYSWDMLSGGTMHFFANVFQYKVGNKTYALLDQPLGEGDNSPSYHKLFLLKAGNKTYYLAVFVWVGSTKDFSRGIQVFAIENGKLNSDVKLIKTKSGLHNTLSYEYDIAVSDSNIDTDIHYDGLTQTIKFPLVTGNGKVTNKLITYKFNGKYFEKVSNLAK